jgi:arginase family enzyme
MTRRRDDPEWPRASDWLAGGGAGHHGAPRLAVLGAPLSATSISPSRAHMTPGAVRSALSRFSTAYAAADPRDDVDLETIAVDDLGDIALADLTIGDTQSAIAAAVADVTADLVVILGGDNAVTRPSLRGRCPDLARTGLLTLDAHHDLRGFHAGITNGTPVRGLLDDGLPPAHIVQIGLGSFTNSRAHRRLALEAGITVVTAHTARDEGVGACVGRWLDALAERCDDVWVDLDVDVLDETFAPGCPGARPGGLAPWELLDAAYVAGRHPVVTGLDIVEVDAADDASGCTVDVAAQCLLHAAAGLASRTALRPQDAGGASSSSAPT